MSDIPPVAYQLAEQLGALPKIKRVILFGSRARGDNAPRADIDLAIDAPEADNHDWLEVMSIVEEAPTLLAVDVVWLPDAGEDIRTEVQNEGILLYERKDR